MQHFRVDSTAIVAHQHFKMPARIFYFDFDTVRLCMHKCIQKSLAANAIDFIADQRPQWTRNTINNNAKISFVIEGKFLSQSREGSLKALVARFRCAQPTQRISTFFSDCTHQLQDPFQERFGGRVLRELVFRYIKLERGAQNTLEQRVMQNLRNARALGEPLLEANIQSFRQLVNAQAIKGEDRQATPCKTSRTKPPRLPKRRFDHERDRSLRAIPKTDTVRGNNAEEICARAQVFIDNLPRRNDIAPTLIGTIELIAKTDSFSRSQVRVVVIQGNALNSRGNLDGVLHINLISASGHRFDSHCDLNRISGDDDRIGHGQTRLK